MADPNIYEFDDYRKYLKAWFKARKGHPTQSQFAKRIYCARALVTEILKGKRKMTRARAAHCPRQLGLDAEEAEYFLGLVQKDDGDTFQERADAARRANAIRLFAQNDPDVQLLVGLYDDWLRTVVFELGKEPDFEPTPAWVVARVRPDVTEDHAADALAWLDEAELLGPDAEGRLTVVAKRAWSNADVKGNLGLVEGTYRQHEYFLELAQIALRGVHGSQRHYGALTSAMSEARWQQVRDATRRFEQELIWLVHEEDPEPQSRVVHVQFQLFPLTAVDEAE